MMDKKAAGKMAVQLTEIIVGNLMYAAAVVLFIVPNGLITGGTTGLALFINRMTGLPISVFVSAFNITMFLLGAWILGKQFAVTTVLSTVIYPLMLGLLEGTGTAGFVMEERLVAVLYAGLLIGTGIGVVMRAGASTGGMDIPALILKKKWNINVSMTIYLMDCIVLALQLLAADSHAILYGILLIIVYTMVLDKVLVAGNAKIQVKIVTTRYEEINRLIGERLDCGTSLLHMETGYLHREQEMILAVISKRDLPRLNGLVLDEDPEAFMVINQINEVRGRGFTLKKVYR
ncbi:YitT family protein [Lacrimispora sp. 210928-DFI.3.58]|nr:YitT family protein [Lacrimispora sp. 210928-DFI.3.58]MCB7317488.1 YitT family protein [Lacrimispora sp. 210928-DFI.3.58]